MMNNTNACLPTGRITNNTNRNDKSIWRLIISKPLDGPSNMAIDEAIFIKRQLKIVLPTLRFYQWHPPAISLGYFQDALNIDLDRLKELQIDYVRRPTGGGIVFHDQELTFSLAFGKNDLEPVKKVIDYYKIIGESFRQGFKNLGLETELEQEKNSFSKNTYFCYAAPDKYDVVIGNKKLVGMAQRCSKNTILQQGSIIIDFNNLSISGLSREQNIWQEATCLKEHLTKDWSVREIALALTKGIGESLKIKFQEGKLTTAEEKLADKIREEKYLNLFWNLNRKGYRNKYEGKNDA